MVRVARATAPTQIPARKWYRQAVFTEVNSGAPTVCNGRGVLWDNALCSQNRGAYLKDSW